MSRLEERSEPMRRSSKNIKDQIYRKITQKAVQAAAIGVTFYFLFPAAALAAQPQESAPAMLSTVSTETTASTETTPSPQPTEGWLQQNDHWLYINKDATPAIGWKDIDGSYYHFKADGTMSTGAMKVGETQYTFTPEKGSLAYARKEKNTGGGSFAVGFYDEHRQALADNLNELKEDYFDGDEDEDYYEDEKVNYDKDASFIISGRLTEIAEHRLIMARTKGYGNGEIPVEGNLNAYIKSIRYNSGRRFLEVYLKACDDADDAEQKLLRSHGNDEKKRPDRAVYYSEMGIAHQTVDGKQYYMIIFMK